MFGKSKIFSLLFVTSFLIAQIAEAGLVRTSGRGVFSANYDEAFYFVENQYLNEVGISEAAWNAPGILSTAAYRGGGASGLDAVPDECTKGGTTVDEKEAIELDIEDEYFSIDNRYDNAEISQAERDALYLIQEQREADLYGESCVWEFEEGESLSMFAFFGMYFGPSADINYDVKWRIDGKPTMDGEINLATKLAPNGVNNINEGWITLDSIPSFALPAGDYSLRTSVSLTSSTGKFFWESGKSGEEVNLERTCIENPAFEPYVRAFEIWQNYQFALEDHNADPNTYPHPGPPPPDPGNVEPDFELCGYNSIEQNNFTVSSAPTFFVSEPEQLRILQASSNPVIPAVAAPASLGVFFLGLGLVLIRIKRR
ncbi:hypothetical protein [Glaciecola sp.]|jgi:hypothetical protein|uniref:hypothetical protein n=1 Tax=Glaciecola sp. MF2-115 TaxID=3384827 RepID=UPI00398989D1